MLTLLTGDPQRDCQGTSRRSFLRVGTLGLGGWTLSRLLATQALATGARAGGALNDKAVVLLFLSGGASQIETFDPKMSAAAEIRSTTGELTTSLPGVTVGGTFPRLATLAHKLAVVRSFQHKIDDHVKAIHHVLTAGNVTDAGIGAIYARLRGANDPQTAMPTHGLVTTQEVDGQYSKEKDRVQISSGGGTLGMAYSPFDPSAGSEMLDLMRLKIPQAHLESRRRLLASLDGIKRKIDDANAIADLDRFEQRAFDLILRNAGDALDLSKEDPRVLARYDTGQYQVGHKQFRACSLGRQFLMARRMVEAGCGFVTVHNAGWDMHADGNNPGIKKGMEMLGPPVDHAVSAFLEDLQSRGLEEKVLLVITGDFGRTPALNKRGGRDHWAALSTLAFAGGGLKMGQVIGRSTRQADAPASQPILPMNLLATLLHTLFKVPVLRLQPGVPRDIAAILDHIEPIRELFPT